jgi:hypothetical protein
LYSPRPDSVTDLLTTLGELPFLKSMTLDIVSVDTTDLPQLFEICSRLKSLEIRRCQMSIRGIVETVRPMSIDMASRNWNLQASAHKSTYNLEELSLSSNCGIGLSGFISRSPRLRVLSIYQGYVRDIYEEARLKELIRAFSTEGSMPSLQHLDVCIYRVHRKKISEVLKSVRCLRSFQCLQHDALLSIPSFWPHFSTITKIVIPPGTGTPEVWQEIMSSCPALVEAREVVLFAEDITGGKMWASTGLESLDLHVFVRSKGDVRSSRKAQEDALFRRIAKLVKLIHLSVHTGWHEERTLRAESWGALLRIETLRSVELGNELTAYQDKLNVLRRFSEKQVDLTWNESNTSRLSDEDAEEESENALILQALSAHLAAHSN